MLTPRQWPRRGLSADVALVGIAFDDSVLRAEIATILGRDLPWALRQALYETAVMAKAEVEGEIKARYDRPTKWTQNSVFVARPWVDRASGSVSPAAVFFKDRLEVTKGVPAGEYLGPTLRGRPRRHKSFEKLLIRAGIMKATEYAVPSSRAPLDAHGNVPRQFVNQILSQLQAQRDGGQNETLASRAKKFNDRTGRWRGRRFFAIKPGMSLPRGIYERIGPRQQRMVFAFVERAPGYRVMLPFREIARRASAEWMPVNFNAAARAMLARRAARRK